MSEKAGDYAAQSQLDYRLSEAESDQLISLRVDLGRMKQAAATRIAQIGGRIEKITAELRSRERGTVFEITDHALVRYLERKHGLDASAMRAAMIAEVSESAKQVKVKGEATGLVANDLVYVVSRDYLVVTVYPAHEWELD